VSVDSPVTTSLFLVSLLRSRRSASSSPITFHASSSNRMAYSERHGQRVPQSVTISTPPQSQPAQTSLNSAALLHLLEVGNNSITASNIPYHQRSMAPCWYPCQCWCWYRRSQRRRWPAHQLGPHPPPSRSRLHRVTQNTQSHKPSSSEKQGTLSVRCCYCNHAPCTMHRSMDGPTHCESGR
jgi:hypothetical protein